VDAAWDTALKEFGSARGHGLSLSSIYYRRQHESFRDRLLEVAVMTLLDLVDHIAAEVAAATAGYAVADALHLAAAADAATTNVKPADDFAAAAYATADADLALIVAQYAVADACWRSRP